MIWHIKAYADPPPRLEHAKLTMQRNGNLVFRDGLGAIIWQTHTAGTGHHNRLVVQDNGRFVIRNGSGAAVWRSHTNPRILAPGVRFTAGEVLSYRQTYRSDRGTTAISCCSGRRVTCWQSHTSGHPGSWLWVCDGSFALWHADRGSPTFARPAATGC